MNRRLLATIAVSALMAGPAMAADLGAPVYKAPPPIMAPVAVWTGYSFGGNVGYSWARETNDLTVTGGLTFSETEKLRGVIGGVQSGYNWQIGNIWVLGLETDIQASGERGSQTFCIVTCT